MIHIGLPKTGLTFMQTTLLANLPQLKAAGIWYPDQRRDKIGNHYKWVYALDENPRAAAEELLNLAQQEGADRILLSAENFLEFLAFQPGGAAALKTLAQFFEVELVLVLRRQDDLFESYYAQAMPAGLNYTLQDCADTPLFDYLEIFNRLTSADESIALRLAPFSRDRSDPMASLTPLAKAAVFDVTALSASPISNANNRSTRRMTLFLSQLDTSKLVGIGRILRRLDEVDPIADDGGKCLTSPEFRHGFWQRFAEGNQQLCQKAGDPALEAELCQWKDIEPGWTAPAPITAEEKRAAMRVVYSVSWSRQALIWAKRAADAVSRPFRA